MKQGGLTRKILKNVLFTLPFYALIVVYKVYDLPIGYRLALIGAAGVCAVAAAFRWTDLYSRTFKDEKVWDIGFDAAFKRVPRFIKDQPELNVRCFTVWKWIATAIITSLLF